MNADEILDGLTRRWREERTLAALEGIGTEPLLAALDDLREAVAGLRATSQDGFAGVREQLGLLRGALSGLTAAAGERSASDD